MRTPEQIESDLAAIGQGIGTTGLHDDIDSLIRMGAAVGQGLPHRPPGDLMAEFARALPEDFAAVEAMTFGVHVCRSSSLEDAIDSFLDDEALDRAENAHGQPHGSASKTLETTLAYITSYIH